MSYALVRKEIAGRGLHRPDPDADCRSCRALAAVAALEAAAEANEQDVRWALEALRTAGDYADEGSVAHRASTYLDRVLERLLEDGREP